MESKEIRRIGDLAKELDLTAKTVISILSEMKFKVSSPRDPLTPEMESAVREYLQKEKEEARRELERKKQIWGENKENSEQKVKSPQNSKSPAKPQERYKETIAKMTRRHEKPKKKFIEEPVKDIEYEPKKLELYNRSITVGDLAKMLGISPAEIIQKLFSMGMMVTINHTLDEETIDIIADEYGYNVEFSEGKGSVSVEHEVFEEERSPVVTVMGHVDHGKTTLLDFIRHTNVAKKEVGEITQHIGAYQVEYQGKRITFLDTPGHEAFTAMRARGAQVTDIIVLVVSAVEGVKEQTIEAINHAKSARVPIIVAINKIDLPNADPERVRRELTQYSLIPEEWGGDTLMVDISAKTGKNVDELLLGILLKAEEMKLKSTSLGPAKGVVIESRIDRGKGPLASVLIQRGTLKVRDNFVAGLTYGRVRAMFNDWGEKIEYAGPSTPVAIQGCEELPVSGDSFEVVPSDTDARRIAEERKKLKKEQIQRGEYTLILKTIQEKIKLGELKELTLIVKADCYGSVEAIQDSLSKMSVKDVKPNIIYSSVGAVTENDVELAHTAQGVIIAFNTPVEQKAKIKAKELGVTIKTTRLIYELIEDVEKMLKGLVEPVTKEVILGKAEVRRLFRIPKIGVVAGSYVIDGTIQKNARARVYRDGEKIFEGRFSSLKRFQDDVREVQSGFECGIKIEGFDKLKEGDIIECYNIEQVFEF
ncbi:MAG TPA: translation initiation factor IF-2 [Candidatus Hydrothermia bacterium]|nr:translation initiation factor IF-2 [Candidatus Hydrothermia bacterium]HOL23393.1 translation initiation factor IF-2 [Candidatus Hydrothermia bacterium]HPO78423.1 translation initiation factor IF-2 [Candidatus Hydrothermia bacterium]